MGVLTAKEWRDSVQKMWDEAIRESIQDELKQAVAAERKRCYDFLMNLHMQAGGKHNYYHVAANQLLEAE